VANEIKCPACQSEIGADGKSLVKRSAYFEELEKAADVVEKLLIRCEKLDAEMEEENKKHAVQSLEKKSRPKGWLDTD